MCGWPVLSIPDMLFISCPECGLVLMRQHVNTALCLRCNVSHTLHDLVHEHGDRALGDIDQAVAQMIPFPSRVNGEISWEAVEDWARAQQNMKDICIGMAEVHDDTTPGEWARRMLMDGWEMQTAGDVMPPLVPEVDDDDGQMDLHRRGAEADDFVPEDFVPEMVDSDDETESTAMPDDDDVLIDDDYE